MKSSSSWWRVEEYGEGGVGVGGVRGRIHCCNNVVKMSNPALSV